jgi:hypothetical protein
VGAVVGLDAVDRKISFPYQESNPGGPTRNLSLYRLSYPGSSGTVVVNRISVSRPVRKSHFEDRGNNRSKTSLPPYIRFFRTFPLQGQKD